MLSATDIVLRFTEALDGLAVPYMLVGSFSSNFYGRPRPTMDADFVLNVADLPLAALRGALGEGFQVDPQMSFETVTGTTRWLVTHSATAFKVELFQLSDDPHDQARFQRRTARDIEGHAIVLPTVEDVIVTKLRWSKVGNRAKDAEDVREILASQSGRLGLAYIRGWCDQHGTRELFERLLAESPAG